MLSQHVKSKRKKSEPQGKSDLDSHIQNHICVQLNVVGLVMLELIGHVLKCICNQLGCTWLGSSWLTCSQWSAAIHLRSPPAGSLQLLTTRTKSGLLDGFGWCWEINSFTICKDDWLELIWN